MLLGFGVNMWMCLPGSAADAAAGRGISVSLVYIIAVRLTGTVLGNVFPWSGTVFLPVLRPRGTPPGTSHRSLTVNIAGAIMMVEESILTLCLPCWLFLRTALRGRGAPGPARTSRKPRDPS